MTVSLFSVMGNVNESLLGQIQQSVTDAQTLLLWTDNTLAKTKQWLTDVNANLVQGFQAHSTPTGISNWLENNTSASDMNQWSSQTVLQLQSYIASLEAQDSTPSDWNAVLGDVGSLASIVSSTMTQDTTTGNTETKNMQSQLQMDNSAQQPIASFGSAWAQTLSSLSSVLGQMSVA